MSRYSKVVTLSLRVLRLPSLLQMPIPQTAGHDRESIFKIGAPISIDLSDGSIPFDAADGVFDDDADVSP